MATGISKTKWNGHKEVPLVGPSVEFQVTYEGKVPEISILSTPPAQPFVIWPKKGDIGNTLDSLYFGENLSVLSFLLKTLRGKVQLVYIDPPFSSRMVYHSRSATAAYTDLLTGAKYLEFLRQRLVLIRELLSENGSLYVHLDDKAAFPMKVILDEVFGTNNFRNWITRKKCNPKNFTRKAYGNVCDYILFYTKSDKYIWNRQYEPWTEKRAKEYQYVEPSTGRRFMKVPVHAPGTRNGETGQPWRGIMPPSGKHWQYPPRVLDEMDARGEIYWSSNDNPRRKVYFDESPGVAIQDLWLEFRDPHNQNIKITGYPTEKNSALLSRIIEASSNEGDLVLDCFAGSGTTLAIASELGRHWIGVDNSPHAITTILKRFLHGTERMGDFVGNNESEDTMYLFKEESPMPQLPSEKTITDFTIYATEENNEVGEEIGKWESSLEKFYCSKPLPLPVNSKKRTSRVRKNISNRKHQQ